MGATSARFQQNRHRACRMLERLRSEKGAALVEFGIASILYLLTLIGTTEFGLAVWRYNMVSNLAQEGARWASVRGAGGSSPASAAQVETFVQGRTYGMSVTVTTTTADPTTKACTGTTVDPSTLTAGSGVCV